MSQSILLADKDLLRTLILEMREKDAFKSFFSGHTSIICYCHINSNDIIQRIFKPKKLIWASSYTTAAITGYLRIAADKHYFTDVLAELYLDR